MSEVEKMYENAGIEKAPDINNCYPEMMKCHHCEHYRVIDEYTGRCLNEVYPLFTAEKQLELIKFLFNHNIYYDVDSKGNYWFHISDDCYTYYYSKFEIALANIINEMWQDLTEEEKQEIKRILT